MSVDLAPPLIPTEREDELGREEAAADFTDRAVVIEAPNPFAGMRPTSFWGRRRAYLRNLDPRQVEGPLLPLFVLSALGFFGKLATDAGTLLIPEIQTS